MRFIGFTISQVGLVRHWLRERTPGWVPRAVLNGTGAAMSAMAGIVFFASKFTEGAWLLVLIIPALMLLFGRTELYYRVAGAQLGIGRLPDKPLCPPARSGPLVIVPVVAANLLTKIALETAMKIGGEVEAVCVDLDHSKTRALCDEWKRWDPGLELRVLPSPHRNLVPPVVGYVRSRLAAGRDVAVLLAEVQPRKRRHEILHNQRGVLLATALRARTDAIVATVSFRLK